MKHKASIINLFLALLLLFSADAFAQKEKKKKKSKKETTTSAEIYNRAERQAESYFLTGMKFYILEDYEKAMENFKKAHSISPNSAGINFQIAELYLGSGMSDQALPYAQKALELDDENIYYYQILALTYRDLGKIKQAAQTYEALLKKHPSEIDIYFELSNIYLQQNDFDAALKALNKVEKKYGVIEELVKQKQRMYLQMNRLNDAVLEGKKLIDAYPEEHQYKVELAAIHFSNNQIPEAQKILTELEKEDNLNGDGYLILSDVYKSQGNMEKSGEALLKAFSDEDYDLNKKLNVISGFMERLAPYNTTDKLEELINVTVTTHPESAQPLMIYGDFLVLVNRKEEALKKYQEALKAEQSNFQLWQQVLIIESELDMIDSSIIHSHKALEFFPNQAVFWYFNGSAYLAQKEYKKGIYALEKAKAYSSDKELLIYIYAQLGDAYNANKEHEKSDLAYEEVLKLDPENQHVLNNYSYFLAERNEQLDKAKQMSEKLMKITSNNSTYIDTYAWVLYRLKNYTKAKEWMDKVISITTSGTLLDHYGDILYQLGKQKEALEYWKKAKAAGEKTDFLDKKIAEGKLYE